METLKSLCVGLAALILLSLWLCLQPRLPKVDPRETIGRKLFPAFDDPAKMSELSILRFVPDADASRSEDSVSSDASPSEPSNESQNDSSNDSDVSLEKKSIRLIESDGVWKIADYFHFPAENAEQTAKVVSPLTALTVLSVSEELSDANKIEALHAASQVLDPSKATLSEAANAGILVKISDKNGDVLVDLIVGRQADESSAVRDVRYVRVPGENTVYTVDFSAVSKENSQERQPEPIDDVLSVEPLDWANRDLLRISRWNVKRFAVHDYKKSDEENGFVSNGYCVFEQDPTNSINRVWTLVERLKPNESGKYETVDLASSEEANNPKLNETVDALSKWKIADILKKPESVARVFRENRPIRDMVQQNESLEEFGFFVGDFDRLHPENADPFLTGENGETTLLMKDGVEISILFGKEREGRRVLLLAARFNENSLPPVEILPLQAISDDLASEEKAKRNEENRLVESENNLRTNERRLLVAEGIKRAKDWNDRVADWLFLIDEADFQKSDVPASELLSPRK